MDEGFPSDPSTRPELDAEHKPTSFWRRRSALWIAGASAVVLLAAGAVGISATAAQTRQPSASRPASPSPTVTATPIPSVSPTSSATPSPTATQAPTLVYIDALALAGRTTDDAIGVVVENKLGYTVVPGGPAPLLRAVGTVATVAPLGYQSQGTTIVLTVFEDVEPLQMPGGYLYFEIDGAFAPSPLAPGLVVDVVLTGTTYPCPSWAPTFSHFTVTTTDGAFANGQRTIETAQSPIPFTIGSATGQQRMRWTATCSGPEGDHVTPSNQQGFPVG